MMEQARIAFESINKEIIINVSLLFLKRLLICHNSNDGNVEHLI